MVQKVKNDQKFKSRGPALITVTNGLDQNTATCSSENTDKRLFESVSCSDAWLRTIFLFFRQALGHQRTAELRWNSTSWYVKASPCVYFCLAAIFTNENLCISQHQPPSNTSGSTFWSDCAAFITMTNGRLTEIGTLASATQHYDNT